MSVSQVNPDTQHVDAEGRPVITITFCKPLGAKRYRQRVEEKVAAVPRALASNDSVVLG